MKLDKMRRIIFNQIFSGIHFDINPDLKVSSDQPKEKLYYTSRPKT